MDFSKRPEHSLSEPILTFDLTEQVRSLTLEKQWKTEGHDAITLVKSPSLRIVLMILQAGAALPEHSTSGTISVQVLSGSVDFIVEDKATHLKAASLLSLASGIPHSVHAIEESVVLLTVVPKSD